MRNRGFTLVELLVALVILAVGLLAVARMSLTYVRANTFSHVTSAASVLAQEKMEELRAYASGEQGGRFSVFNFDYLVSTDAAYTSIEDPPGSGTPLVVPGLLAGATASAVTTSGGTTYEVLYDDGNHGDGAAGDGVYGLSETVALEGTPFSVTRTWTVEPIDVDSPPDGQADYARLAVETSWTDRLGTQHTIRLESVVYRR